MTVLSKMLITEHPSALQQVTSQSEELQRYMGGLKNAIERFHWPVIELGLSDSPAMYNMSSLFDKKIGKYFMGSRMYWDDYVILPHQKLISDDGVYMLSNFW